MADPDVVAMLNASRGGFNVALGLVFTHAVPDEVSCEVPIGPHLVQPYGLVHGGVYASIAESIASIATARAVIPEGDYAVGLSNQTSFLRPITEGTVHAEAIRRHRGRTTWLWDVEITDDAGRVCAVSRMTIAVRPQRG